MFVSPKKKRRVFHCQTTTSKRAKSFVFEEEKVAAVAESCQVSALLKKIDNRVSTITNSDAFLLLIRHPHQVAQIFESFLRAGPQAPVYLKPADLTYFEKRVMSLISLKMGGNTSISELKDQMKMRE